MSSTTPVAGYRPLNETTVELANAVKTIEEGLLRLLDQSKATTALDPRWVAIAQTHFQEGFMALNRANFKPQRLEGEIDVQAAFLTARNKLAQKLTSGGAA